MNSIFDNDEEKYDFTLAAISSYRNIDKNREVTGTDNLESYMDSFRNSIFMLMNLKFGKGQWSITSCNRACGTGKISINATDREAYKITVFDISLGDNLDTYFFDDLGDDVHFLDKHSCSSLLVEKIRHDQQKWSKAYRAQSDP